MRKVSNILGILLLVAGSSAIAMAAVAPSTPEIDPASAGSAIALVSGMVLMFRARRAK
jgi:Spy/CpxP family protein refolding chaperone